MKDWKTLKKELLKDKLTREEYDKLTAQYELISQLITARHARGMSQKELAEKANTKQSAIARLESGSANPTIGFLEKITQALGTTLQISIGK